QVDETCDEPLPDVSIPLDMIVIGQEIDATYRNLIESNNGQIILTSLLQFSASLQSLPTNDGQLSLLTIPLDDAFDMAQLDITFANGNTLNQVIQAQGEFVPPATPTPVNTPTSLPTETVPPTMTTVPIATDIPATDVIATDSLPTEAIIATDIPLVADNSVERATIANQWIIVVATIASVFVVVVVVLRLLRSSNDDEATVTPSTDTDLSGTLITAPATEQQLAQTEIFTIREVASSLGPTHVANLINTDEDIIYEIHRPQSILGRQVGSDILIADDPQISREHVRFDTRKEDDIWLVRLTNNPILVNGIPIENTRQLDEGDVVQLSPKLQVIFVRIAEES
ncbi:MAG: FHA domain-containing protein, partial [Chloroflexota bacterium]